MAMKLFIRSFFLLVTLSLVSPATFAAPLAKVMVLDFQLNDMTDLPNAPEELARVSLLSAIFKQKLAAGGIELVPVTEQQKAQLSTYSATYLFDHTDVAAQLAGGSGADYIIVAVALKPTYLFVYPRVLVVDVKTKAVVLATYAQLESSWQDKNTTTHTAEILAKKVIELFNVYMNIEAK